MFYRELYVKTAKEMRDIGGQRKKDKQQSALNKYREKLIQIADSIVQEENSSNAYLEAAVIVGSIARGNHTLNSDLDLYLVYSGSQSLTREERKFDRIEAELFRIGAQTLMEQLQTGEKTMFLFKDGLVVYEGEKNLGTALIEQAKAVYEAGVGSWSEEVVEQKKEEFIAVRQKVRKLMEKEQVGPMLILSRYTLLAIEVFYNLRGLWQPSDKDIYNDLKEKSPQFADLLENCLQQWLAKDRFNFWLKLINYAFEPVGGLPGDDELKFKD